MTVIREILTATAERLEELDPSQRDYSRTGAGPQIIVDIRNGAYDRAAWPAILHMQEHLRVTGSLERDELLQHWAVTGAHQAVAVLREAAGKVGTARAVTEVLNTSADDLEVFMADGGPGHPMGPATFATISAAAERLYTGTAALHLRRYLELKGHLRGWAETDPQRVVAALRGAAESEPGLEVALAAARAQIRDVSARLLKGLGWSADMFGHVPPETLASEVGMLRREVERAQRGLRAALDDRGRVPAA